MISMEESKSTGQMATAKNTTVQEDTAMLTAAITQQDDTVMKLEDELAPWCSMHLPCFHKKLALILTDAPIASGNLSNEDANTDTKVQFQEFLSEFLDVYTCGAYGSSSSDPATAQVNKSKSTASVEATDTAAAASTTTSAKNDGGSAMEEFISEFVSFYSLNVGLPTLPPPQSSTENNEAPTNTATNGQLAAKDEEEGAIEEFLREFIAFYSMGKIGTTDVAIARSRSAMSKTPELSSSGSQISKSAPKSVQDFVPAARSRSTSSATSLMSRKSSKSAQHLGGQLAAKDEEEEGAIEEFLREFIAFYSLGRIGTTDSTSTSANNTSTNTLNNEPSIEKAKANNPEKSTSEEEGLMKEFIREFVAFYTLQGDEVADVGGDNGGEAEESPMFAPAVSPEEENAAAAADNSPAIAESRNDTPTVDKDDDTDDDEKEEDDAPLIEAVANNADNGLRFPRSTTWSPGDRSPNKVDDQSITAPTKVDDQPITAPNKAMMKLFSSASPSSSTKQKKKSSRSSTRTKVMMKLLSKKRSGSSSSTQAVE